MSVKKDQEEKLQEWDQTFSPYLHLCETNKVLFQGGVAVFCHSVRRNYILIDSVMSE